MSFLSFFTDAILSAKILIATFLAILFLQSGIDKITDWAGNLGWLKGHFAQTPLKGMVPILLGVVTVCEVGAGLLSAWGAISLLMWGQGQVALWGAILSALSLTMLFFGQRIAKDYAGAATLVSYFLLSIIAIVLLS
jgi:hypothetical protein